MVIRLFVYTLCATLTLSDCNKIDRCYRWRGLNRAVISILSISVELFPHTISANADEILTTRQRLIRGTENFLTNPVLEAVRRIDQTDSDDKNNEDKAILLFPIVQISQDISAVKTKLESLLKMTEMQTRNSLIEIKQTLEMERFQIAAFKKIFNRYADNIYYSDPKQANLYLAGGTLPSSDQTQKYLIRNAILTKIEDLRDDVNVMLSKSAILEDEQLVLDTIDDAREAMDSFGQYFELCDKRDLSVTLEIINSQKN